MGLHIFPLHMPTETENKLEPYETKPNAKGIKLQISYRTDEDGTQYKVTKKVLVIKKVPKGVAERKKTWKKFGETAKIPRGELELGVTYFGDEVQFEPTEPKKEDEKVEEKTESVAAFTCRHCGGLHWTHRCTKHVPEKEETRPARPGGYVLPQRRGRGSDQSEPEREITTLRVSNLSEDCTDDDLRAVFSRYG